MIDYFELDHGISKITVNQDTKMGSVIINSIEIKDQTWEGYYIEDIPIRVKAEPKEGYVFEKWKSRRLPPSPEIIVNTRKNKKIIPVYRKI